MALFTHLYGIKPWEVKKLTETQLVGLMRQMSWLLFLRDRPMRDYQFMKLDHKKLANPDPDELPDPSTTKARKVYFAGYGLPEHVGAWPTRHAARDFVQALKKKRVPNWVLAIAPPIKELEELAQS